MHGLSDTVSGVLQNPDRLRPISVLNILLFWPPVKKSQLTLRPRKVKCPISRKRRAIVMRSIDADMILISKRVSDQSIILARIVHESRILRATSDKLLATIRSYLVVIKLELGRLERQGRQEPLNPTNPPLADGDAPGRS